MITGYCTGVMPQSNHVDMEERAHRLRRIARVLRHDLDTNPPKDEAIRKAAEARCQRYSAEAAAHEIELRKAIGY